MDWDEFERKAIGAIPDQPLKAKRCWVGVLLHDVDWRHRFDELQFIWMKGHSKIPLEKIYETYGARKEITAFQLVARDGVADKTKMLKDYMTVGSDSVFFKAVLSADPSSSRDVPGSSTHLQTPSLESSPTRSTSRFNSEAREKARSGPSLSDATSTETAAQPPYVAYSRANSAASPSQRPAVEPQPSSVHQRYDQSPVPRTPTVKVTPTPRIQSSPPAAVRLTGGRAQSSTETPQIKAEPYLGIRDTSSDRPQTVRSLSNTPLKADPGVSHPHNDYTPNNAHPISPKQEHRSPPVFHNDVEEEPSQPFDAGNFFNREPSPEQDTQDEVRPTDESIRAIIKQEDPVVLETGVQQSLKVLEDFKQSFSSHIASSPDAQAWVESIDKLIPQAQRKRTVVGVVGNTGAGKSSVINAMLDEERLVPTNCMRACTAVVTEMSWNDSKDPSSKYRAEIEFITRADWEKEVAMLMKEFLTESGSLQREASDQSTDAGIAWAKFHAVHPKINRDELGKCTVPDLMSDRGLSVLGTTKKINTSSPQRFYQELQKFVDSKEKVTKKDKEKKDKSEKPALAMEYWPLIKVVKIYTKAPALSTGAVIVDLPGVHDSNAARAAVAQGYIKQCTGLWIVAPITRAVDDKAAKTLLGDSFKMQLKYDGGFSSVTFICSKTDDISITEATETLQLDDEVGTLYQQQQELEQEIKDTKNKIEDLKESQEVFRLAGREASDEIEIWEDLKDRLDDGEKVYAPAAKSTKRKKGSSARPRKKRQVDDDDSDADFVVDDDEVSRTEDEDEEVRAPQEPLTEEEVKAKLKDLKETKKNARRQFLEIKPKIEELRPQVQEADDKIKAIKAEISRICISGRNEYSKEAIQNDFAAGIKELDQENAAEEDEDNFNPDEEQRDYDKVARSLPVFCVSSRAYQKMCGRLKKDDAVPGFNTPEETEMPQLQAHCKKLTEAGRVQSCRNFLLSVCQLLTTFTLWASNDGSGSKMTDDDKRKQVRYLERRLNELEDGLEACVKACLNVMKREMNEHIFDKYPDLIQEAVAAAPATTEGWGAHREAGGLLWATYKAVVRRDGTYTSRSAGPRDFNSELVDPIMKKLATGWERAFQSRLPKAFTTFIADSGKILHKFHESVEERARQNGVGLASLSTLKTQIYTYEMLFGELNQVLVENMTELQREANRDFTPTIANIMHTVYEICADERGPGSFKRMKTAMSEHVERNRHHMFTEATVTVKRHLDAMCRSLEELMEHRADEILIKMKADYMRVLGGVQLNQEAVMSREERSMRGEIMNKLRAVDAQFEPITRGEVVPDDVADVNADAEAEQPTASNDDDSMAFESANEDAIGAAADAEPQKSVVKDDDGGPSSTANKTSGLPSPLSNEVSGDEL